MFTHLLTQSRDREAAHSRSFAGREHPRSLPSFLSEQGMGYVDKKHSFQRAPRKGISLRLHSARWGAATRPLRVVAPSSEQLLTSPTGRREERTAPPPWNSPSTNRRRVVPGSGGRASTASRASPWQRDAQAAGWRARLAAGGVVPIGRVTARAGN